MKKLLFVNACMRGESSRSLSLARVLLDGCLAAHPDTEMTERNLMVERPQPLYPETLAERDRLWAEGALDAPVFDDAHQFASADKIVIAAPFWDLGYPALLRAYLERVSVVNITFGYRADGSCMGLCKADKLVFVTTRGGIFSTETTACFESGAHHIKALCAMFGIPDFRLLCAEGLDDVRNDAAALLAAARVEAARLALEL